MDRKFIIILVVLVLGLGGLFVFGQNKKSNDTASTTTSGTVSNHSKGGNAKNVELLVYGDFQCPVCGQFYPIETQVVNKYQQDIKFTFRHFPLDSIHQNARAASRSAEAAGNQGKFFEMHDLLYENQNAWSELSSPQSIFESYAKQLGLNLDTYNKDVTSEAVNSVINADRNAGTKAGVSGTPTYFINGKKIDNADINTVEKFSAKIEEAIKNSN